MRVLFLDIDGVLNNRKSMSAAADGHHPPGLLGRSFTVDPEAVETLRHVVEQYDLKIVVSSTWRRHMHAVHVALRWAGWTTAPIIDHTSTDPVPHERGAQIDAWLQRAHRAGVDVSAFVIVDDDDIHQKDKLVRTDNAAGLTVDDAQRIADIINAQGASNG